jgi:hypothetical protein
MRAAMSKLILDWATHEATAYACRNWHYSKSIPTPPLVKIGVWEDNQFIGVVLFGRGASPQILKPYGLQPTEGCELVRIALQKHNAPVSRIVALATRMLKKINPGLRLIVSYADPEQGHTGIIYQASNWIYSGETASTFEYIAPDKKKWHSRMVSKDGWKTVYGKRRRVWRTDQCERVKLKGKHRYLMPLDKKMRKALQQIALPYPKRSKQAMADPNQHSGVAATT